MVDFSPPRRIEENYFQSLLRHLNTIVTEHPEEDSRKLLHRFRHAFHQPDVVRSARETAAGMITLVHRHTDLKWREAARESSRGREIYAALRHELTGPLGGEISHQVARNAELIRHIPPAISTEIVDIIREDTFLGKRPEEITIHLRSRFPSILNSRLKLIARTEVSKTTTALTKARAEQLHLPWYIWRTNKDERVRTSHKHMEDVICLWSNPPDPEILDHEKSVGHYNPGEIWNCRCYPDPLTDINRIAWPHRVAIGNSIRMVTKADFQRLVA